MNAGKSRRAARNLGVFFAAAAVTVTAPRLALAFLAADGVEVPRPWRIGLLTAASVATAVVLTGGTAYLAHAIAVARSQRAALIACWAAALGCSGALIAPAIVATLRSQSLAAVLGAGLHWSWSVCAVLAVDLVASGAMLADAPRPEAEGVSHPVGNPVPHPVSHPVDSLLAHPLPDALELPPGSVTPLMALPSPCPWGCGKHFATRDAANGHGRHCSALAAIKAASGDDPAAGARE